MVLYEAECHIILIHSTILFLISRTHEAILIFASESSVTIPEVRRDVMTSDGEKHNRERLQTNDRQS